MYAGDWEASWNLPAEVPRITAARRWASFRRRIFSYANESCDIVVCTGIGFARDFIVASSADGIIAVGGGVGTLIEMGVGYMTRKTVVAISGTGGVAEMYGGKFLDERNRVQILVAPDALTAVEMIVNKGKA